MDDMNAFERQVAGAVLRGAAPPRPVDAAAIFKAITTSRSPRWRVRSLFSATRLVVAGAIVALFGGFLITGTLTMPRGDEMVPAVVTGSPSPMTTRELISSMVTEEVEPGVLRVLDDGTGRDLTTGNLHGLTISPEGRVWLLEGGLNDIESMYELGREDSEVRFDDPIDPFWSSMAFTPDGVAWATVGRADLGPRRLASFDGERWTEHPLPDGSPIGAIEATPDGALLVTQRVVDGPGPLVARLDDDGWTTLPNPRDPILAGSYQGMPNRLAAAPDGTIWLSNGWAHTLPPNPSSYQGLLRYDGERWQRVELPPDAPSMHMFQLAAGPDGTLWSYARPFPYSAGQGPDRYLLRWANGAWNVFSQGDGVPALIGGQGDERRIAVGPDGTLWMPWQGGTSGTPRPFLEDGRRCPAVVSFDGSAWTHYLEGHCSARNRLAIAADGAVWVTSTELGEGAVQPAGLYVITPEAVADAE